MAATPGSSRPETYGPYREICFIVFREYKPYVHTLAVMRRQSIPLDLLSDERYTVFKLPAGRRCEVEIAADETDGSQSFVATLKPTTLDMSADAEAFTASIADLPDLPAEIRYCRDGQCEPYEIECPDPQIPTCESFVKLDGSTGYRLICSTITEP